MRRFFLRNFGAVFLASYPAIDYVGAMQILHYNCVSGISGDMNLSALLDMGADVGRVAAELKKLGVGGWKLSAHKAQKLGVWGTQVLVECEGGNAEHTHEPHTHDAHSHEPHTHSHESHTHSHEHRSFADIKNLISTSSLSGFVKEKSLKVFEALARAEAQIHNRDISQVHFHEVGAVDSIIDIVGGAICLELLGVEKITVGAIELGGGFARCAHGVVPVPAPATALLARGFNCSLGGVSHEATTPTGMAFLAALAAPCACAASGEVLARGIGVGMRDCPERANVLQAVLLEDASAPALQTDNMHVFSANIDDMTPEAVAVLCARLFEAGAADVWQRPIVMKKSRAAVEVCALVSGACRSAARSAFFKNSTTLGLREVSVLRSSLPRETALFNSSLGAVRIKKNLASGAFKPEAEDVSRIALENKISFAEAAKKIEFEYENPKS